VRRGWGLQEAESVECGSMRPLRVARPVRHVNSLVARPATIDVSELSGVGVSFGGSATIAPSAHRRGALAQGWLERCGVSGTPDAAVKGKEKAQLRGSRFHHEASPAQPSWPTDSHGRGRRPSGFAADGPLDRPDRRP